MYPHEMIDYIQSRNYELNKDETFAVIDPSVNTHLTHVKYNPYSNSYDMWDRYGNYYYFRCKGD